MGCSPSKNPDTNNHPHNGDAAVHKNGRRSKHVNGNGTADNSDTDSVEEFLAQVKEAKTLNEIYRDQNRGTRDSLTGGLSLYVAKKKESITLTFRKLSKEKRRDTLGREVKVSPVQSSTPDSVDEYISTLKVATESSNERRKSAVSMGEQDEEAGLLRIRDDPTRTRRLSSRTPKFQPILELRMESPPTGFKVQ
ncbi:hypothetical protein ACHWQZ_G013793 [Mnemiopsis leidyi]